MRFRVNIKYSLISESPNLQVAKAIGVRRIVCGVGEMILTQRRRGAESAELYDNCFRYLEMGSLGDPE